MSMARPHRTSPFAAMVAAALCSSCAIWTTAEEGRALRRDVDKLRERQAKLESEIQEGQTRLAEMIDRARADLATMEETLTRATRVLARNSADFGADMESMKDRQREVDGAITELRHDIEEMRKNLESESARLNEFALAAGLDLPVDPAKIPARPEDHAQAIRDAMAGGRYGEARSLAKAFLDRYPASTEADDVAFLAARSHVEQKKWSKALGALRQFVDRYPKSDLVPDALYEMARAFFEIGDCTDARILVETIGKKHGKTPSAAKAKALEEQMAREKTRCTS